ALSICTITLLVLQEWDHRLPVMNFKQDGDVMDFTNADNETGFSTFIVPNIVHFIRLGRVPLSLAEVVCMRAAWIQQRPERLMIHCDECEWIMESTLWEHIKDIPGLTLSYIERPSTIFGVSFSWIQHTSDVLRCRILMSYGGIYLDGDSYLVRSLDDYRRFEMSLGWPEEECLGNQVLVAHKDARFLKLWYESYRFYRPDLWYWNAGELPTQMFLTRWPYLVHRVPVKFGVSVLADMLYETCNWSWRSFDAIHLLFNHRDYLVKPDKYEPLNMVTISYYKQTFGDMARLVLFGTAKIGTD
ncbi:unnamed protein product, partial [Ixodes hexagonus]